MADKTVCTSCDRGCQICDVGGQSTCNRRQTFSVRFGTFKFSVRPTKDVGQMGLASNLFNEDVWQEIYNHLNQRTSLFGVSYNKVQSLGKVSPFTAEEFNHIASEITGAPSVSPGMLIEGKYFTDLENALNKMYISTRACDDACNASCQSCDGTKQKQTYTYCCSCDTCQTACQHSCQSCDSGCNTGQDSEGNACGAVQW